MTDYILVQEEERKVDAILPFPLRLMENLENENILLFEKNFDFTKQANKLFENCFEEIIIDYQNKRFFKGNKEKKSSSAKLSFLQEKLQQMQSFIITMFPHYSSLSPFLASFIPSCEKKDFLSLTMQHFFFQPSNGARILTMCINIDMKKTLSLVFSNSIFETIAKKMVQKHQIFLPSTKRELLKVKIENKIRRMAKKITMNKLPTSLYDIFMFRLHKILKEKNKYDKEEIRKMEIKSGHSCLFFTDSILHNFKNDSSYFLFSYLLPRYSLINPEKAPISILERMSKEVMKDPKIAYFT